MCRRERTEKHQGRYLARDLWEGRDQSGQEGHASKKLEAAGASLLMEFSFCFLSNQVV